MCDCTSENLARKLQIPGSRPLGARPGMTVRLGYFTFCSLVTANPSSAFTASNVLNIVIALALLLRARARSAVA